MGNQKIFLFDIDGVLVDPLGYRMAVPAAAGHFTRQMGLDDSCLPSADVIAVFEANRITSEWDMVPLSLAVVLDHLAGALPGLQLSPALAPSLPALRRLIAGRSASYQEIDYYTPLRRLGNLIRPGLSPSECALQAALNPPPGAAPLFQNLSGHPILVDLLQDTRSIERSQTTRTFQHFSLGSEIFSQTYDLPPEFESGSYLLQYDRPCLPPGLRRELLEAQARGQISLAAYTLRPSLPPREVEGAARGYAPEAEMALDLTGLSRLPLVGFGRIRYLALLQGVDPEVYLKPSPVQALAAILAALTGREKDSLVTAARLVEGAPTDLGFLTGSDLPPVLEIHVFEDSCGGIEAVHKAAGVLEQKGISTGVHAWGIAVHPEKVAALTNAGVPVYAGTAEAVRTALST